MSTWESEMTPEQWQTIVSGTVKTEQTKHMHQWDNYLHTAYVLVRTPLEHHCNLCSVCHRLQCEATNVCGEKCIDTNN